MADPTVTIIHEFGAGCALILQFDGDLYDIPPDGLELPETLGNAIVAVPEWALDIEKQEE
jgi:hypothetical protein